MREESSFRSRTETVSTCKGGLIAKALSYVVAENLEELCTTRASWRANDRIEVNVPSCQANGGCITKGLYVNVPETHSVAADEASKRQSTVGRHVSMRQGHGSQSSSQDKYWTACLASCSEEARTNQSSRYRKSRILCKGAHTTAKTLVKTWGAVESLTFGRAASKPPCVEEQRMKNAQVKRITARPPKQTNPQGRARGNRARRRRPRPTPSLARGTHTEASPEAKTTECGIHSATGQTGRPKDDTRTPRGLAGKTAPKSPTVVIPSFEIRSSDPDPRGVTPS